MIINLKYGLTIHFNQEAEVFFFWFLILCLNFVVCVLVFVFNSVFNFFIKLKLINNFFFF